MESDDGGSLGSFPTKKEAERAEREALSSRDRGIDLSPNSVTVAEMISRYLSDASSRCGGKTMERYRELASNYIEPHLGSIVLSKLRPASLNHRPCAEEIGLALTAHVVKVHIGSAILGMVSVGGVVDEFIEVAVRRLDGTRNFAATDHIGTANGSLNGALLR